MLLDAYVGGMCGRDVGEGRKRRTEDSESLQPQTSHVGHVIVTRQSIARRVGQDGRRVSASRELHESEG